jgi:DNA-binding SARP family transcriptional activator/Tfp pilus assembly protein PilF
MIHLRTLGALELRTGDGKEIRSVLRQSKRLALLAYLAVAAPRGFHRRATLLGLFWPELGEDRARAALSQSIYFLREALGREVVVNRGPDEVGIAWDQLECDAVAFEDALDAGATSDAVDLYRGDLLPGLFLSDTLEWERWLELERGRLRRRAAASAWQLAEQAGARGAAAEASRWGQRSLAIEPDDETRLRQLIVLLDGLGDRAGALNTYTAAAQRLERDYGIDPDPETRALIEAIRARHEYTKWEELPHPPAPTAGSSADTEPALATPPAGSAPDRGGASRRGATMERRERAGRRHMATWLLVATALAAALWTVLQGADTTIGPGSARAAYAEAVSEYEKGRHQLAKLDPPSAWAAKEHFERALDLDPSYADAWSGLAAVFQQLARFGAVPSSEAFPRSRAAAERALDLDPLFAEAHTILATALTQYYWDNDAAERHYRRAISRDPGAADSHRLYAAHLRTLGRFGEALAEARMAQELDPLSALSHAEEALILYLARDYEAAIHRYHELLRLTPQHRYAYVFIALARAQQGHYDAALSALDAMDPTSANPDARGVRGYVHARKGDEAEARRILESLHGPAVDSAATWFHEAVILIGLGDHARALDRLERSADQPTWQIRLIGVEPTFDPLRQEARFQALLRRVNLPDGEPVVAR